MVIEIWNNVNGYHWRVEAAQWMLESNRSAETAQEAERTARLICKQHGVKVHRVDLDSSAIRAMAETA